jgi:hypothetical protein
MSRATQPEVNWGLLPNDLIIRIIGISTGLTMDYWVKGVTEMKGYKIPSLIPSHMVRMIEFHMNKRMIIRNISSHQSLFIGEGRRDGMGKAESEMFRAYMKAAGTPWKVKAKKTPVRGKCRCSICGKVGHNKSNSKFH